MHRTFSVPRLLGWWSLFAALALHFGIHAASAQNPLQPALFAPGPQDNQNRPVIELAVGSSRACQMSSRADLKRVENPNSRVVRVERSGDKSNEILLVAENPGQSLVTFVDQQNRTEVHLVVVGEKAGKSVDMVIPVNGRNFYPFPKGVKAVKWTVDREDVVNVFRTPGEFQIRIEAKKAGVAIIEVTIDGVKETVRVLVTSDDRVAQLRDLIKKLAPYDTVEVHPLNGSRASLDENGKKTTEDTVAVLLSGTVAKVETATLIDKAARALFPPTLINTRDSSNGVNVERNMLDQLNVINQIRIGGVHQVELQVVVAVVNRTEARNMSFSFNTTQNNWFVSSLIGGPGAFTSALTTGAAATNSQLGGAGNANIPFGVSNGNGNIMGFLQLLRTEGLTKILAEPKVVTLSGRPAYITSGGETPVLTSSGTGAPTVSYKPFGTVVKFLPIVMGNGKIHLEVNPEISNVNQANGISIDGVNPTRVPGFDTRSAAVTVMIEDGQTLAIGGLIQNRVNATISRVPVLGDLPYLGMLFTSKANREEEEELIILVTPRLVDPVECCKIPQHLPGQESRTPDDFELFLEGIMEAPRGKRSVVFHPHHYRGAHTGASNYGQYPCVDGRCNVRGGAGCANGSCAPGHQSYGQSHGMPGTRVASPTQSYPMPEVSAIPTTNTRIITEPEAPIRETIPNLGPVVPTSPPNPMPPARQLETRPLLPPISSNPYVR